MIELPSKGTELLKKAIYRNEINGTPIDQLNPNNPYDIVTVDDLIDSNGDITREVEKALIKSQRPDKTRVTIRPSELGGCSRSIVYNMVCAPKKPTDATFVSICDNGTMFHNRYEAALEKAGLLIADEATFTVEGICTARTDAIIKNFREHTPSDNIITIHKEVHEIGEDGRWKKDENGKYITKLEEVFHGPDNDIIVIELKSVKSSSFQSIVKSKKAQKIQHVLQLQFYMHHLQAKHGALIYENKDTQKTYQINIDYDEEMANIALNQAKLCCHCVKEGLLPKQEYDAGSFECTWCSYLPICRPEMFVSND